jgi:phosphatidylglycerophosphatase A
MVKSGAETTMANSDPRPRAGTAAWLAGTFFGAGRMPVAPGTAGSAAAVALWWLLTRWVPPTAQPWVAIALIVLAVAIGIPAATRISRETGLKDPQMVVIDEVAGQLLTLLNAPVSWKTLLAGFILFRVFDTLKPPPVRQLEALPEGTGVVVDDVGAGIYGLIIMQVLLHFGVLR